MVSRLLRNTYSRWLFSIGLLLVCSCNPLIAKPLAGRTKITYAVTVSSIALKRLHIQMTVNAPPAETATFIIPAWSPGYYQILDFDQSISHVVAKDQEGDVLKIDSAKRRQWRVRVPANTTHLTFDYDLAAKDTDYGFFGSSLKEKLGYINGSSAFMYVEGQKSAPCLLQMRLPARWKVATALPSSTLEGAEPTDFQAKDYDELVDSPLQFGKFETFSFKVQEKTIECALVGSHQANIPDLTSTLRRVVQAGSELFGSLPFERYLFIFHCGGEGFDGGLEHRNSTVIHTRGALQDGNDDEILSTISHEFLHLWNVKRIRPANLGPFDYTQAVRTTSVWFAEGVTDYYALVLLVRSGQRSSSWFVQTINDRIRELDSTPARRWVSLEEASFKAWEGGSMGFGGLSYYLKGSLIGFYFDVRLRSLSQNRVSLDDVMRRLNQEYGESDRGYPEDAILQTLNEIAKSDLTVEYNAYVRGTKEIPWEEVMARAGLKLERQMQGFLGVGFASDKEEDAPSLIDAVVPQSPAAQMGFQKGDLLLKLDGEPLTQKTTREALLKTPPGKSIICTVKRADKELALKGVMGSVYTSATTVHISASQLSREVLETRDSLLRRNIAVGRRLL